MALTQPILYSIPAFDAHSSYDVKFNVVGGDQVVGSTLTIKDNDTLQVVKTIQTTSFVFTVTIPANTLTNGKYYQASLVTENTNGDTSPSSNIVQFYCYTTPTFSITNIPSSGILSSSSFSFDLEYTQQESEALNSYSFFLYNAEGVQISTSGNIYTQTTDVPFSASYLVGGLSDNTFYSAEFTGVTSGGTSITTGKQTFVVRYSRPASYTILELTNNCSGGYITVQSNAVSLVAKTNPSPPTYIDNKEVNISGDGEYVLWDEDLTLSSNWTIGIWGRNFNPQKQILEIKNNVGDKVVVSYCQNNTKAWFELKAIERGWSFGYYIISEEIDIPTENDQIFCWIRKINNIYNVKIENKGVEV